MPVRAAKSAVHARLDGIPVEEKLVNIAKQEQTGKDYKSMNPLAKLPCLQVCTSLFSCFLVFCTTSCDSNHEEAPSWNYY